MKAVTSQLHTFMKRMFESGSPERPGPVIDKAVVDQYLESLRLFEQDLQNKRVLDLGCERGDFIRHLLRAGITQEAYGLDREVPSEIENCKHIATWDLRDTLPYKGFDTIVAVGTLFHKCTPEGRRECSQIIENALDVLKEGGTLRIFPISRDIGKGYEGLLTSGPILDEILQGLLKDRGVTSELISIKVVQNETTGEDDHEDFLLILRKPFES